jgi:predicted secreted protein
LQIFDGKQQQEITVSLQETFSVLLKGNPTTGFSWEVSCDVVASFIP